MEFKKLAQLTEYLPELIQKEVKLSETIQFVEAIGEKWERRLKEKQTNQSTTTENKYPIKNKRNYEGGF